MAPGTDQGRDGGYGDVIAEDRRGGPGSIAVTVEDDIIDAYLESEVDILFDMLSGKLKPTGMPLVNSRTCCAKS